MKIFLKILSTIICVPLGIVGAICLMPFVILSLLIGLPEAIVEDIWDEGGLKDE